MRAPATRGTERSMAIEAGRKAPAFALESDEGKRAALKDFAGKRWVVLYFYPKDDTPGCTTEACDFRDGIRAFTKLDAEVIGISPDSARSHAKFKQKHNLNFTLLADEDHSVCEKYGVWVEKSLYGRKYLGVERTTLLIEPGGKIVRVWEKVKVPGHVAQVAEALMEATSGSAKAG
jgi:thioredoxin-dependent peroxiredoxin